ncbi:hypothetical protein [Paraburkholderia ultramafica]|uniref:hypothetical protein n=1 Tax=Paraburkholderia ultramafica TaxID=1544867 RepID=UPI0031B58ACF
MGYKRAVTDMLLSGYAGVYLSVVETGRVDAGSAIRIVPGYRKKSIADLLEWRRSRVRRESVG